MKRLLCVLTILLLSGCATNPEVQTAVDPDADPGRFRTFVFVAGDPSQRGAIKDAMVRRRLEQMVASRMVARGYSQVPAGQRAELGVHLTGHVVPKQRVYATGGPGPYDYGWGARRQAGGDITVDYREGTLFVDVIELGQKRLLWRARVSEALTPGYSEENWMKVDRALAEAFKSLPPRR